MKGGYEGRASARRSGTGRRGAGQSCKTWSPAMRLSAPTPRTASCAGVSCGVGLAVTHLGHCHITPGVGDGVDAVAGAAVGARELFEWGLFERSRLSLTDRTPLHGHTCDVRAHLHAQRPQQPRQTPYITTGQARKRRHAQRPAHHSNARTQQQCLPTTLHAPPQHAHQEIVVRHILHPQAIRVIHRRAIIATHKKTLPTTDCAEIIRTVWRFLHLRLSRVRAPAGH